MLVGEAEMTAEDLRQFPFETKLRDSENNTIPIVVTSHWESAFTQMMRDNHLLFLGVQNISTFCDTAIQGLSLIYFISYYRSQLPDS